MAARGQVLRASFFDRDAAVVAPELLGRLLMRRDESGVVAARIVEVEAYRGSDDPGAHSFRGRTPRNASMFGPPGHLYVYFTYGMHWCANVVCGPGARPHAVLLRAAMPTAGVELMRARRPTARRDRDLLRGPANLARAFGLDGALDGVALRGAITIRDDGAPSPEVAVSARVGLAAGKGDDLPLRWFVPDDPHVSRGPRRGGRGEPVRG